MFLQNTSKSGITKRFLNALVTKTIFSARICLEVFASNLRLSKSKVGLDDKFFKISRMPLRTVYIYQDSKYLLLCSGTFVSFLWPWAEIKSTVHVALPKWHINQVKLNQPSTQITGSKSLLSYYHIIYCAFETSILWRNSKFL